MYWGAGAGLVRVLPLPAAAALLLTLTVLLTRGLHLDGLADTVDGLGGGCTPEQRLAIMKDSRLGAFGGVALVLALLLKFTFLLALLEQGGGLGLALFPIISRGGMVFLAYLSPYARPEGGLGRAMTEGVDGLVFGSAAVGTLGLAFLAGGLWGLGLMAGAVPVVWLLSRYYRRQLGGITGDTLGATNELVEILVLGGALFGGPWPPGVLFSTFFW
jgi:adenosylcobinamide-GDP ribazoletransferase